MSKLSNQWEALTDFVLNVKLVRDALQQLDNPIPNSAHPFSGEVGELLGLIADDDPLRSFKGYTDKKATKKKVWKKVWNFR